MKGISFGHLNNNRFTFQIILYNNPPISVSTFRKDLWALQATGYKHKGKIFVWLEIWYANKRRIEPMDAWR